MAHTSHHFSPTPSLTIYITKETSSKALPVMSFTEEKIGIQKKDKAQGCGLEEVKKRQHTLLLGSQEYFIRYFTSPPHPALQRMSFFQRGTNNQCKTYEKSLKCLPLFN